MSLEASTPKTKKTKYTAGQTEIALATYNARKEEQKYAWLPEAEYRPLPKDTKTKIHELRADAYRDDKTPDKENFRKLLLEHADECIKQIIRFENKPDPLSPDPKVVVDPTPAVPNGAANPDEVRGGEGKQMMNPFLV